MDTMPQPKKDTTRVVVLPTVAEQIRLAQVAKNLWTRVAVVCGAMFGAGFGAAWLIFGEG